MTHKYVPPDWSSTATVENYTEFSRAAFWSAYYWQAEVGLQRSGLKHKGGSILDIGCGPGWLTFILQECCPAARCTGLDLSAEMIEQARKLASQQGQQGISFVVGNVLQLPFADNSFDFIISSSSFRLWPDHVQGLQEAYRVLRPGGLLYIADIGGGLSEEQRQNLIATAPAAGQNFVQRALATALPVSQIEEILRHTAIADWECRVGGLCGFAPTEREVMDWLGNGLPLRQLQKMGQGNTWARAMGQHWVHIYVRKPLAAAPTTAC